MVVSVCQVGQGGACLSQKHGAPWSLWGSEAFGRARPQQQWREGRSPLEAAEHGGWCVGSGARLLGLNLNSPTYLPDNLGEWLS